MHDLLNKKYNKISMGMKNKNLFNKIREILFRELWLV